MDHPSAYIREQLLQTENYKVVVGFSGGITSAWCAEWALKNYPKDKVILLFHDTKEEDEDTYRFIKDMEKYFNHPIIEQSDGRSVTELFYDEGCLASNRRSFCSRILKLEQRKKYFHKLKKEGVEEILLVFGFSKDEWQRVQRAHMGAIQDAYSVRFPIVEVGLAKQKCVEWLVEKNICPPRMYIWSGHANCLGCVRGSQGYWEKVLENAPDIFEQRKRLEEEFKSTFMGGALSLKEIEWRSKAGLIRTKKDKESIEIGPCECGT